MTGKICTEITVHKRLTNVKQSQPLGFAAIPGYGSFIAWGNARCGSNRGFCAESAEECVADPGSKGADESLDLLYVIQLIMHPLDCCHHHI